MRRRDFMRTVLAATVTPSAILAQTVAPTPVHEGPPAPGPVPWMQGLDSTKPQMVATLSLEDVAQADLGFFNLNQIAALARLSDLLLPPMKGHPGAKEAGVPEFLDFYISESSDEIKALYRGGLDQLDSDSKQQFALPFSELSASQADSLILPRLRTWMTDHYPDGSRERFINAAHHDIRLATINSPAWAEAAGKGEHTARMDLYWSPVEPDVYGERSMLRAPQEGRRDHGPS